MKWLLFCVGMSAALALAAAQDRSEDDAWAGQRRHVSEQATRAFAAGDWQEASHLYQRILEKEPENPLILANLGAVEYQLGDLRACCHYLERALSLKEDLMASREMLGMAYYRRGEPLRAVAALARAVADQPESPRAHNQLAVVLQSMEWYDGAAQSLRHAIRLDPEYGDAHFNLALIYVADEPPSLELARRHYGKARQLGVPADEDLEKRLEL